MGGASAGEPVAYVEGRAVTLADLGPGLLETAGGQVLLELVIDRALSRRLAEAGITLGEEQTRAEEETLLRTLSADGNEAARLLGELKRARGLGPSRYAGLLRRNAGLRALVGPGATPPEGAVRRAFEVLHGPRYEARLIVVAGVAEAARLADEARKGGDVATFVRLALEHSTDPSRAQGGLLPLVSPADVTFPAVVRDTLGRMTPGQVSDPLLLESGSAVLRLDRKIEADGIQFDDVKGDLEWQVRLRVERGLMEDLVRQMLRSGQVVVSDPGLRAGWEVELRQLLGPG